MPILPMPDPVADRECDEARQNPDQETLELAAQGAAKVLGAAALLSRTAPEFSPHRCLLSHQRGAVMPKA